jgi:thymidylate kinase
MSRPNGRQKRAIEGLATALQECFDVSIEVAEKRFEQRMESRFEKIDTRFEKIDTRFEKIDTRLEKQDDTLRMIWTQCGGKADQRLPIDD